MNETLKITLEIVLIIIEIISILLAIIGWINFKKERKLKLIEIEEKIEIKENCKQAINYWHNEIDKKILEIEKIENTLLNIEDKIIFNMSAKKIIMKMKESRYITQLLTNDEILFLDQAIGYFRDNISKKNYDILLICSDRLSKNKNHILNCFSIKLDKIIQEFKNKNTEN